MKAIETRLQSVLVLYCLGCVVSGHAGFALLALPILGTMQVLSAAIYRLNGGKSKERTVYGIMVVLCLSLFLISSIVHSIGLAKFSFVLSGVAGVFYTVICWREILSPRYR